MCTGNSHKHKNSTNRQHRIYITFWKKEERGKKGSLDFRSENKRFAGKL